MYRRRRDLERLKPHPTRAQPSPAHPPPIHASARRSCASARTGAPPTLRIPTLTTADLPCVLADRLTTPVLFSAHPGWTSYPSTQLIEGRADEVEPDGAPNALNIPVSSLNTNIWYHLGLAYYLNGDLENARRSFQECVDISQNDDMLIAATHWLYMILRRQGRDEEAARALDPVMADMDIIENMAYHRLALFYKGELTERELTGPDDLNASANSGVGYGLGNWHYYNGDTERALEVFEEITSGRGWGAFGFVAAEADLSRMQ